MADVRKAGPLVGTLSIRDREDASKLCEILAINGYVVSAKQDYAPHGQTIQTHQWYLVHIYVEEEVL